MNLRLLAYLPPMALLVSVLNSPAAQAQCPIQPSGDTLTTAFGTLALSANTTGVLNAAFGWQTLQSNTTGFYNMGIGGYALFSNQSGSSNTAIGTSALFYNTTGCSNTAMGTAALASNATGNLNTALGGFALYNSTGSNNIGIGNQAGTNIATGSNNIAIGNQGAAADSSVIRIGTEGSQTATFIAGIQGTSVIGGSYVAVTPQGQLGIATAPLGPQGPQGPQGATGPQGVAGTKGPQGPQGPQGAGITGAIIDSDEPFRTAVGFQALANNTVGVGFNGRYNTASGYQALGNNTTGHHNTASGAFVLSSNTTGPYNTTSGAFALDSNTTGGFNTASGSLALGGNTTGNNNTASGASALLNNTTGSNNIALGQGAGQNLTTGSSNIAIGNNGVAAEANTLRIGTSGNGNGQQNRAFIAGISGANVTGGVQVFIKSDGQLGTVTSSRRFKTDIRNLGSISNRLLNLRPVTFRYKQADEQGAHPLQYGLIAEEVAKVYPDLVQYDKQGKPFTVYYHLLTPLLLSEVQHQKQELVAERKVNNSQQAQLATLRNQNQSQRGELVQLKQQLTNLQTQQQNVVKVLMERLNQLERTVQINRNGSSSPGDVNTKR